MMNLKKITKKINLILCLFLTSISLYGILSTSIETIVVQSEIAQFVSKGEYVEEISSRTVKYYRIESDEEKPAFTLHNGIRLLGSSGDILLATGSPFPDIPFVNEFISFFFGQHAALVAGDYEGKAPYNGKKISITKYDVIETTGLADKKEDNCVSYFPNNFHNRYEEIIGLRPKNATQTDYDKILSYAYENMYKPYNYSFVFNTKNKYYCTDLVSRAYKSAGFDLNHDHIATTVNDLITSEDSYIFLYQIVRDGVRHVYYLD